MAFREQHTEQLKTGAKAGVEPAKLFA